MSFVSDVRTFVLGGESIAALVDTRMHYQVVPAGSHLPAIVYFRVSTVPERTLVGKSGLQRRRMQIGARASTALEAEQLADLILERIEAHVGEVGESAASIVFLDRGDGWDPVMESYADDIDVAVWVKPNGEE